MQLRVVHKGLILVGVPLVLELIIVGILFALVLHADSERMEEARHKRISEDITAVAQLCYHAGYSIQAGFKKHDRNQMRQCIQDIKEVIERRGEIYDLTRDHPDEFAEMQILSSMLDGPMEELTSFFRMIKSHKLSSELIYRLPELRRELGEVSANITTNFGKSLERNERYLEESPKRQAKLRQTQYAILVVGLILNIVFAFFLAKLFMRGISERLSVIKDNTIRLAQEKELNPVLPGNDEIASLDHVFHQMAADIRVAAEREKAAFENASDVICVLDEEGRFIRLNPACARIWKYAPEELLSTRLVDIVFEDDRQSTVDMLLARQTKEPSAEFENRLIRQDGEMLDILWSVYWSDAEQALFCVAHDISERRQLERMKEEFLAMVSHDLRSPLASIYGVFQLLTTGIFGVIPAGAAEKIDMAKRNVNRLLALVNDVLDIGKLESGKFEIHPEPNSVVDLLQRSAQEVEALSGDKRVSVSIQSEPITAVFDMDRMIQVVVNLLSNAMKFSPENGVVTLKSSISGGMLRLDVIDQGRGVPTGYRQAIFEKFKQVQASDGKRRTGTGLGLPICKQIVEQHGGRIGVDSEEGKGSDFWILIPAAVGAGVEAELPEEMGAADLESSTSTRKTVEMPRPQLGKSQKRLRQAFSADSLGDDKGQSKSQSSSWFGRFSPRNLSLLQKGAILVGIPVLFEIIFVSMVTIVLVQADRERDHELRLRAITTCASRFITVGYQTGIAAAGPHTHRDWNMFQASVAQMAVALDKLSKLVQGDPQLEQLYQAVKESYVPCNEFYDMVANEMYGGYSKQAMDRAFSGRERMSPYVDEMTQALKRLAVAAEAASTDTPEKQASMRNQQASLLLIGLCANVLLAIGLAVFFATGIVGRLNVLNNNARRLAREEALLDPLTGTDELAYLDTVFHAMAQSLNESRHKARAVFDNSQDLICAFDAKGKFLRANPAAFKMWGYEPAELLNTYIFDIVSESDVESTRKALYDNLVDGPLTPFENHVADKAGVITDILWSASWSEKEQMMFCIAHDISKRKELERFKQEFLTMVSHDLRTPLGSITGITKLMIAGAFGQLPDKAREQLLIVTRNADRLVNLINDLLDLEKLESGQMQLTIASMRADQVLQTAYEALSNFAEQKGVQLRVEPTELWLACDEDRLAQVLINLISNAIKFSPQHSAVTLAAKERGDWVELSVTDQGRGIPETHLVTIFERFKQVEASDGKRRAGTGLGLPICKQIIESHGGTIGVNSTVGVGSSFWCRLMKTPSVPPAQAAAEVT